MDVTLGPKVATTSGPIYFNENVAPDTKQKSTSIDGGVIFYRLDPGEYTMSASKDGFVFNTVEFQCRAGIFVNAGPPMGPLASVASPDYAAGATFPDDADTASTDALCEATAKCVNDAAGVTN